MNKKLIAWLVVLPMILTLVPGLQNHAYAAVSTSHKLACPFRSIYGQTPSGFVCSNCGAENKLGNCKQVNDLTCEDPVYMSHVCAECETPFDKLVESPAFQPQGHTFPVLGTSFDAATKSFVVSYGACQNRNCNATKESDVVAGKKEDVSPATCTEPALVKYYMWDENYNKIYSGVVADGEPAGHDWADGVCQNGCGTPFRQYYGMTVSSIGPRFKDVSELTNKWHMFSVVDLSQDGTQTLDLIAGNIHKIGTVTLTVADGAVTVDYDLYAEPITLKSAFFTLFSDLAAIETLDTAALEGYAFGEAITLGEDTTRILYVNMNVIYANDAENVTKFYEKSGAYTTLVENMLNLMK